MKAHSDLLLLIDAVARVRGRLRSAFDTVREGHDLAAMEATVLAATVEATHPPTIPQIGRSLGHPRQVIQRAAKELIAAGLIDAAPNPDHKRAKLLVSTTRGREVHEQANTRAEVIAEELVGALDLETVRKATALLNTIRAGLEQHQRKTKS